MTFVFETEVLPLLQAMSADPLGDFPLEHRVSELEFIGSRERLTRYCDYLRDSGYVAFEGPKQGDGTYAYITDARLTVKGLKQLDLWPADNERALHLLSRIADAFATAADDVEEAGDPETAGRLRNMSATVKAGLREVGTEVAAKVAATLVMGG